MTSKTERFIERMAGVFGPPNGELASVLARHLAPFKPEILSAAAEHFILTRKWKTWPMPVEILRAAKDASARASPQPLERRKVEAWKENPWAEMRCVRADALIESGIGVRAAEEGWLEALWNFCRRHERLPDRHEAKALRKTADAREAKTERAVASVIDDGRWTPKATGVRAALLGLHEQMRQVGDARMRRVADWAARHGIDGAGQRQGGNP